MTKKIRWGHLSIRKGPFFSGGGRATFIASCLDQRPSFVALEEGWGAGRERERYANRWKAVVDKQGGEASKKRRSGERSNPGDFRGRALSLFPAIPFLSRVSLLFASNRLRNRSFRAKPLPPSSVFRSLLSAFRRFSPWLDENKWTCG